MKLKPIEQQVVAVVGASSGIGRETALQFAKRNAKVVVSARTESALASLVAEIKALGGDAIAIPADVAEFEQVKSIADKTIEHYGRLDLGTCGGNWGYCSFRASHAGGVQTGHRREFDGRSLWRDGGDAAPETNGTGSIYRSFFSGSSSLDAIAIVLLSLETWDGRLSRLIAIGTQA
jgi:short chain dehydrogenase